jgi:NAD(P)-dependent dehydrogenase (short-subunit alcohol dehydrogenase family)
LTTRRGRESTDDHHRRAEGARPADGVGAIEAKAVAEARDLTPDEAERVDAIREAVREFGRYQALLHVGLGLEPTLRLRHLIEGLHSP